MKLFQRLFFAVVLSGLAAGLAMSAAQQWRVVPLILEAETYETAEPAETHSHDTAATTEAAAPVQPHAHDAEAWAPQDGAERTAYTVLANVLGGIGFVFLMAAVATLAGMEINARNGIAWGIGGFLALQLAPALGLPPELPGMPAADVAARQLWWVGTAVATGAGLLIIARLRNPLGIAIAAALFLAPHLIGAPVAPHEPSAVPAHLATSFAANALGVGALFWLIAGPLFGWLNERFARSETPALKGATA
jgi:cobalt transporter subunit CbtA